MPPCPALLRPARPVVRAPPALLRIDPIFHCAVGPADSGELDQLTRVKRRVAKGATLYRKGHPFENIYPVHSGSFKTAVVSSAGDEKVIGIHLAGEIMGLDAINDTRHTCEAVALQDSEVCAIPFVRLSQLALRMPELQRELLRILSNDITRDQGLMLLMGGMSAEQRIASFLLGLSRRHAKLGRPATPFNLHMTRHDIGSYLGLALETVSRVFSSMQRECIIEIRPKEIGLKDMARLREQAGA